MDSGSRGSGPAMTPSISAASRTVRAMGPGWDLAPQRSVADQFGTRPYEGFNPKTPQSAAGMRIEPAPSVPWAIGPKPAATAAAAPPLDAPDVRSGFQGLRVAVMSRLSHMSLWPNAGVLVLPKRMAPARRRRPAAAPSMCGMLSS